MGIICVSYFYISQLLYTNPNVSNFKAIIHYRENLSNAYLAKLLAWARSMNTNYVCLI